MTDETKLGAAQSAGLREALERLKSYKNSCIDQMVRIQETSPNDAVGLQVEAARVKSARKAYGIVLAALGTAGAVEAGRVPDRETFWLLEMVDKPRWAVYTSSQGQFIHTYTDDAWQAGRFENERAAHEMWRKLAADERERWKPVEHMFINKPDPAPSAALDPATVEACAKVAEAFALGEPLITVCGIIAKDIRALACSVTSTSRVSKSSGCVFCDNRLTLHHDESSGFHHVFGGETVPCSLSQTERASS